MSCSRLLVMLLAVVGLMVAPARAALKIEKKPASVQRKSFDPANKPKEMPELHEGEQALCTVNFTFQTGVSVEMRKVDMGGGKFKVIYTVTRVTGTLGLEIVVWTPEGVSAKLKAHEEGHREIAETAYKTADIVAKKIADKIDGRRVEGIGSDWESAEKLANEEVGKLNTQVTQAFTEQVSAHTLKVQQMYDELTVHGSKAQPDEKEAMRQAWAKYGPIGTVQPTTKPAGAGPATKPAKVTDASGSAGYPARS